MCADAGADIVGLLVVSVVRRAISGLRRRQRGLTVQSSTYVYIARTWVVME